MQSDINEIGFISVNQQIRTEDLTIAERKAPNIQSRYSNRAKRVSSKANYLISDQKTSSNVKCCFCSIPLELIIRVTTIALFLTISIITGVLIVYFTASNPSKKVCLAVYEKILHQTIRYDSLTRSVAIGDVNNDQCLDMVVANYGAEAIGVVLGKCDGTFASQIVYSTGSSSFPYFVMLYDFNDDQQLDIAVAYFGVNSLTIFFNNGNGSFLHQTTITTGNSRPLSIVIGHFNNDTYLDIATVNYGTNSIGILLGFNNGMFTLFETFPTGYDSDPRSVVVGDLNNDSKEDIAVANFGTNNIGVFIGYGNGSFQSQIIYATGSHSNPYDLVAADINGDNRLDILVVNARGNSLGIFLGYGDGTFANQIVFSTGVDSSPHSLAIADINNDHFPDVVVANAGSNTVSVFVGSGDGQFTSVKVFPTGYRSSPQFVAVGDFNNDSLLDLVVANNGSNNIGVLIRDRGIDFRVQMNFSTGSDSRPAAMAIGDFNNDTHLDIVVTNLQASTVGILLGFGNGSLANQITFSLDSESAPRSVAVGDFNNDTHLDIVVANPGNDNIGVLFGSGDGTLTNLMTISTGEGSLPCSVATGDLNNDKYIDIVVANFGSHNIAVFLGLGNGTFANPMTFPTGSTSRLISVALADFNSDTYLDIVVANRYDSNVGVLLGYGNGTYADQTTYSTGEKSSPEFVNVADFNNDSHIDIVAPSQLRDYVGFFQGYGNGSFRSQTPYYTGYQSAPQFAVVGDLNNDDRQDVVVSNSNAKYLSIFRGYGNGVFTSVIQYPIEGTTTSSRFLVLADLNKDGRLDIIFADYYGGFLGVLLGYDSVAFNSVSEVSTSYALLPTSLTIADFNQDHQMDIAISNFASNNFDIFYGYEHGNFIDKRTFPIGGNARPRMIISDDCNNDQIVDILVANTGNDNIGIFFGHGNGSFQSIQTFSTESQPYAMAIGDLNNDNRTDIAVANYGANSMGVLLQFDIGAYTALPVLILYYTLHGYIKQMALGDFNNDNRSDIVFIQLTPNVVGILLTHQNGTFADPITYSIADSFSPESLAVGDVNNDTYLDLIVAQSSPNQIGVLLGYGNGSFASQKTFSTGSFFPSFVTVVDFNNDNRLDFVVIYNKQESIGIFLNFPNETFFSLLTYSTGSGSKPLSLAVGDFDNDQYLDIVVANTGTNTIGIFLVYGNGSLASQMIYPTDPGISPCSVAIGDFNKDNNLDIVVVSYSNGVVGIYLGYGNGTFASPKIAHTGSGARPRFVCVGHFNDDNYLDIAVAADYNNVVYVLLGYGDGALTWKMPFASIHFYSPQQVLISDFNGDGRIDYAVYDFYRIYVFFGSVLESFLSMRSFSTGNDSFPRSVGVGDLNDDNNLDIIVANSGSNNIGVFLGLGFGDFANQIAFSTGTGSIPYSIGLGDFNHDNRTDIAVTNYGLGNIGIFLGHGNGSFTSQSTYATNPTSDPGSLFVGDVNNDSRLDIVVANFYGGYILVMLGVGDGTFTNNTIIYMGYDSLPIFVGLADLNRDAILDIAIVNYGYGNIEVLSKMC